ncbi:hypothetical protein HDU67_006082 [Dinochytrium kinnereticum]|nr:hypothetical protein HDU67_006082 [Dinochytrium kinnereticum]
MFSDVSSEDTISNRSIPRALPPIETERDEAGEMDRQDFLSAKTVEEGRAVVGEEKGARQWSLVSVFSAWMLITGAYCRWAVLLALVQTISLSTIQAAVFTLVLRFTYTAFDNFADRTSFLFLLVYHALYVIAQIFSFFLVWDAARRKNTIQVIASTVFNFCILVYSAVMIKQLVDIWKMRLDDGTGLPERMGRSGMVQEQMYHVQAALMLAVFAFVLMFGFVGVGFYVAFRVYQEIGWCIFQVHGASLEKRRMLRHFHLFIMLLKINIFFNVGIVLQSGAAIYFSALSNMSAGDTFQTRQAAAWSAGIALTIVAALYYHVGASAARRASAVLMAFFLVLVAANMCGLVAGIVIIYKSSKFKFAQTDLTWFIAIQALFNLATFANAFVVYKDFSKGLREIVAINASKLQVSAHTLSISSSSLSQPMESGSALHGTSRSSRSLAMSKTFKGAFAGGTTVKVLPPQPRSVPVLD